MSDLVSLTDNAQVIQKLFATNSSDWCVLNKAGKSTIDSSDKKIIMLSTLAQLVASFYNVGYILAADKNKLLETSFSEVFTRHLEYNNYKVLLILTETIDKKLDLIKENGTDNKKTLLHTYYLTKLFILNIFKRIYKEIYGINIYDLKNHINKISSDEYLKIITFHVNSFVIEIDSYLEEVSQLSNYKSLLKKHEESDKIIKNILKAYQKDIEKDQSYSLDIRS